MTKANRINSKIKQLEYQHNWISVRQIRPGSYGPNFAVVSKCLDGSFLILENDLDYWAAVDRVNVHKDKFLRKIENLQQQKQVDNLFIF